MSTSPSKITPDSEMKKLRKLDQNMVCPNCGTRAPIGLGFGNVCVKFNTFVCDLCKTSHQAISHRVKSITMSNWTMEEVEALTSRRNGGNDAALRTWLKNAPSVGGKYPGGSRPKAGDRIDIYKQFIVDCYECGKFKSSDQTALSNFQTGVGSLPATNSGSNTSVPSRQTFDAFQSDDGAYWGDKTGTDPANISSDVFDFKSSISGNQEAVDFLAFSSQVEPSGTTTSTNFSATFPSSDIFFDFASNAPVVLQNDLPPTPPTKHFDDPFGNDLLIPLGASCAPQQNINHINTSAHHPPAQSYSSSLDATRNNFPSSGVGISGMSVLGGSIGGAMRVDSSSHFISPGHSVGIMGGTSHFPGMNRTATMGGTTGPMMGPVPLPFGRSGPYGYGVPPVSSAFGNIGSSKSKQSTSFDFLEDALKQQLR